MARLIFLDTETTSLDRRRREIWDIAYIIREPGHEDFEKQFFLDVSLRDADQVSLKIGGYWDRHPHPFWTNDEFKATRTDHLVMTVAQDFMDAIIVGAVPSFDEETLYRLLRKWDTPVTWHYHLIDIETLAAGQLKLEPPWDFDEILTEYGLGYNERDRHTALGDARMVRDLYDKILTHG